MSHSNKIFRNTASSLLFKLVTVILAFFSRKLFIMFLSEELLGLSSLFGDLMGLLNLADMGLGVAVQFELYKPLAEKNEEKIAKILNATKRIYNVVGFGIIIAGFILSFFIQNLINENPYELSFIRSTFIINVISSASTYFFVHKRLFLQAKEDLHVSYYVDTIMLIVGSLLRIAAIAIFRNYYVYIILNALEALVGNFFASYFCDKRYPYLKKYKGFTKNETTPLFKNIKELLPNKVSAYIFSNTKNTIISAFIGLGSVTMFTNYNGLVLQIYSLAAMLSGIIRASFGNMMQENKDRGDHIHFMNSYQLLQFFYSSFCGVTLFCLLDDFVAIWYGEKFVVPLIFVILITVDFFIHTMFLPLSVVLEVLGEFRALKRQEIFSMFINLGLSLALVKPFGITGPLIGTFVVNILTTFFRLHTVLYKNYREYFGSYLKQYILYFLIFAVQFSGTYLVCMLLPLERSFLTLILKGIICVVLVGGTDILIFRQTKAFAYLLNKAVGILKRNS